MSPRTARPRPRKPDKRRATRCPAPRFLFACALLALWLGAAPRTFAADWWDLGGDSVCSPEETTALAVYLAEEAPREVEAGPASEDHSRSLQIFRGREHGLVPSDELNAYLTATLRRILEKAFPGRPLPYRVYATASGVFNAAAMPDGAIFLPMGLLEQLENEDELAFVLGHESSHILLAHHSSDWFAKSQYYAYLSWAAADKVLTKLEEIEKRAGGITPGWQNEMATLRLVYAISEHIAHPLWQHGQESCADLLGFDLMMKAGYNPAAATTFLRKLESLEAVRDDAFAGFKDMDSISNPWELFYKARQAFVDAAEDLVSEISNHPDTAQRIEALADYFSSYARRSGLPPRPSRIRQLDWQKEPATASRAILANYAKAYEALSILKDLDATGREKAATLALESTQGATRDHGLTWYSFAQLRRSQNRSRDYEENLEIGIARSKEPSLRAYTELVDQKLAADPTSALPYLEEIADRFGGSPLTLPLRIRILAHNDRMKEARDLVPKCMEYEIREIEAKCREEAGVAEDSDFFGLPDMGLGESKSNFLKQTAPSK